MCICMVMSDTMDYIAHQAPLCMEFSRQEHWSGLPFPLPQDLPNPEIEQTCAQELRFNKCTYCSFSTL